MGQLGKVTVDGMTFPTARGRGARLARRGMIALFLAVLEMVRMQAVVVTQKDLFGEIALKRHGSFDQVFATEQPMAAIDKDYI